MPSTLLQRFQPPASNSGVSAAVDHNLIERQCNLPQTLITEISLHAPSLLDPIPETLCRYHAHRVEPTQVSSSVVRHIAAPVAAVWSVVRRFDNPLVYKHFLKSCRLIAGEGGVGTLREVRVVSGVPAAFSIDRLDILDDQDRAIGFSVIGGEHRLRNYRSVTTLHKVAAGVTAVVESYVVDVPEGNTLQETCVFADTIVRCNLQALAQVVVDKITLNNMDP